MRRSSVFDPRGKDEDEKMTGSSSKADAVCFQRSARDSEKHENVESHQT